MACSKSREPELFGRERERALLEEELARGTRLLSLVGLPGMGKSSLARGVAARWSRSGGGRCVASVVAEASEGVEALAQKIHAALTACREEGAKQVLLLLDDFDLPREVQQHLIRSVLDGADHPMVLVTSIASTNLEEEVCLEIGSLDLGDAINLFQARAAMAGVELGIEDEGAIEELALRLDGSPLAIELAAGRTTELSPAELLRRLDERFAILRRGASGRGSSLLEACGRAWEQLSDEEQRAAIIVSVFTDGFGLEAAESFLGHRALDLLQRLQRNSVLRAELTEPPRYFLFQSMLHFIRRLPAYRSRERELQERHRLFFLEEGERRALRLQGGGSRDPQWLHAERANLLVAFERSKEANSDDAARIGLSLLESLRASGDHSQEEEIANETIDAARDPQLRTLALLDRAKLWTRLAKIEAAKRDLDEALALHPERDVLGARILLARASFRARSGEEGVEGELEEVLILARELGVPTLEGSVYLALGALKLSRGDPEESERYSRMTIELARKHGLVELESRAQFNLGAVLSSQLRFREARAATGRARVTARSLGHTNFEAYVLINLSGIEIAAGMIDEAEGTLQEALRGDVVQGFRRFEAEAVRYLAVIALHQGKPRLAEKRALEAQVIASMEGHDPKRCWSLSYLAAALAAQGQIDEARRSLEEARAALASRREQGVSEGALEVFEGLIAVAEARAYREIDEHRAADEKEKEARALLVEGDASDPSPLRLIGLRLLRQALGSLHDEKASTSLGVLRVGADGDWFQLGQGSCVSLLRRPSLRRILWALSEQRKEGPGAGLDAGELFRAGWGEEEVEQAIAAKRVYTAIWSLRTLGLAEALIRVGDGYQLEPEVLLELPRTAGGSPQL